MRLGTLVAAAAGLLVGFAHLACWDVEFPNTNGQILWRWGTVSLIILPILVSGLIMGASIVQRYWVTQVMKYVTMFLIVLYCMARVVLLVLLGHSFQTLPAAVYDTHEITWLSFIPFIH